jgi:hypothetical protein
MPLERCRKTRWDWNWMGHIEKTKCMLLSRHQNVGQNRGIKTTNRSFENVSQFRYLGTTVTNQNFIQEEIEFYHCYHSVQNLLSSRLLSKNLKTVILHMVLYWCETWSLTLREEHTLRVFENRVLRKIFWPKRNEVTREWRKLLNEGLHDFYPFPSVIRVIKSNRMRWAGLVAWMGQKRNAYRLLVGKPEGKRSLGRPRCRWMDNIRMDVLEFW